jgi:hypothetical protein
MTTSEKQPLDAASDKNSKRILWTTRGNNKPVKYTLTDIDYLTFVRAIEREGSPKFYVAWTLIQRFAWAYPAHREFAVFVQQYAQSINPRWFITGDLHVQWVEKLRRAGNHSEADSEIARANKRLEYATTPIECLTPSTIEAVRDAFKQPSPILGSVHYRVPNVRTNNPSVAKEARAIFADRNQLRAIDIGDATKDNWFFTVVNSVAFQVITTTG